MTKEWVPIHLQGEKGEEMNEAHRYLRPRYYSATSKWQGVMDNKGCMTDMKRTQGPGTLSSKQRTRSWTTLHVMLQS